MGVRRTCRWAGEIELTPIRGAIERLTLDAAEVAGAVAEGEVYRGEGQPTNPVR